jgi:P27 family predicted phage terminase small subunit
MGKRGPAVGTVRGPGIRGARLPARVRIPDFVRSDPVALDAWREWWPLVRSRLAREDLRGFADMCLCYSRMMQAEALISDDGMMVLGANGQSVRNAAAMLTRQYRVAYQAWCDRFGMDPAGRGRLPQKQEAPEVSLAEELQAQAAVRAAALPVLAWTVADLNDDDGELYSS